MVGHEEEGDRAKLWMDRRRALTHMNISGAAKPAAGDSIYAARIANNRN